MNSKLSKFCFYEGPDYAKSEVNWKKELFAGITDRDRLNESSPPRTLACDVMDWADTIAYAVHDLEDAFQANFLRADTIQGAEFEWCLLGPQGAVGLEGIDGPFKIRWKKHVEKNTIQPDEANRIEASEQLKWFKDTFKFVHPHPALLTKSQSLREVASKLIHEFVTSLEVESTSHQPPFHLKLTLPSADLHAKLVFMQCVVQEVVVRDVRVRTFALRSRKMLTDAFGSFEKELDDSEQSSHTYEKYQLFRRRHRDKLKSIDKRSGCRDEKLRLIADMLASMSEAQMLDLYDRLFSPRAPNPYSAFV
jgi:dGTPase